MAVITDTPWDRIYSLPCKRHDECDQTECRLIDHPDHPAIRRVVWGSTRHDIEQLWKLLNLAAENDDTEGMLTYSLHLESAGELTWKDGEWVR